MVLAKIGNFVQFSLYHTRQDFRGKKAKKLFFGTHRKMEKSIKEINLDRKKTFRCKMLDGDLFFFLHKHFEQCDQKFEKNCPNFGKVAKTVAKQKKNDKMSQ
jgi:hypothetical protein